MSVRTWIAGLAGALSLVGVASARDNPPPSPADGANGAYQRPRFVEPVPASDALFAPEGWTGGRSLRGSPPPGPGATGGCQASGGFKIPSAAAFTNGWGIVLTTSATTTSRLDNFRVAGAGSQSLTDVSWSGWFRTGAASPSFVNPTYAVPAGATLPSSFIITLFDNINGEPVQIGSPQTVTFNATSTSTPPTGTFNVSPDTTDTVPTGNTTGTTTVAPLNFVAKLPSAVSLTGGSCYWIEIRPTPVGAATNPTNLAYFWRTSGLGDGVMIGRPPNAVPPANAPTSRGIQIGDATFCVNVPTDSLASGLGCTVGTQMTCDDSPNYVGQVWDGSGAGNATSIADVFTAVDNFTTTCPMTINNVCWYGAYVVTGPFVVPGTDTFRIRVYRHVGGPITGAPDNTPIAERLVSTSGSGVDGTVVRSANTINLFAIFTGTSSSRAFTANLSANPIVVPSGGCYYLEIADANGNNFYVWLGKNNYRTATLADGFRHQATAPDPYSTDTLLASGDFVWAFNVAAAPTLARSTDCVPPAPIANASCSTATPLVIGASTATLSNNILIVPTTTTLPPGCGVPAPNRNGSWFTVAGNGQDITVSTCNTGTDPIAAQTNFDTVVGVYCSTASSQAACNTVTAASLNPNAFVCVASNDDAPAPCGIVGASSVTFPSVAGQLYYIYVWGGAAGGGGTAKGFFYINATTTAGAVTAPVCGTINNCRITVPTGVGTQAENEACGGATNNTCDVSEVLALNTWGTGTCFGAAGTRDSDYWRLPDATSSTTDGGQWFTIEFRAEFPPDFTWFDSPCVNSGNASGVISTGITQCTDGSTFNIFIPAGEFYLRVRSASTGTPACDPLGRGNRYALRVTAASVGACCVAGNMCAVTVSRDGQGLASDPQDCSQRGGVYLGNGTTCSGPDNLPCDVSGGVVSGTTTGSCCNSYGICYVSSDAMLTCTDGVFTAAGTCTAPTAAGNPFTCTAAPASAAQRCCLPNGVCIVVPPTECTSQGGTSLAGTACLPNSCTQPAFSACCDIFGACFLAFSQDCPVGNGVTSSTSTTCSPNPCPGTRVCCTTTGTCTLLVPAACTAVGGTPSATVTTCPATNTCTQPMSVCCTTTGGCTVIPIGSTTCVGTINSTSGSCGTNPCLQPSTVCCLPTGACSIIPLGDTSCTGTTVTAGACNPTNPCPQPTTVCCATDGSCTIIPIGSSICTGQVVTATACAPTNPCTQPTTCCTSDGTCTVILVGGTPCATTPGTGSTCTPVNPCPQLTVCCNGTTCSIALPLDCSGVVGVGNVCSTIPDSCMRPCCTASGCATLSIADCTSSGGVACGALGSTCSATENYTFQACCVCNTPICSLEPVVNCVAANRLPQGSGTVCGAGASNPCARPTACCKSNGTCEVVVPELCVGTVSTGSFVCPPTSPCAQPSTCCKPDGSCEVILVGASCIGGTTGAGSVCGPSALCPQPTTCCLPSGICQQILIGSTSCAALGGTTSTGSVCPTTNICPQPTACCDANGNCTLVNVGATCNGTPRSDTVCPPSPACPPPANDFCCRGTTCNPIPSGTCTGVVAGSNSLVRPSCGAGGLAFATCCYADFNHDGSQSIDDLFLYFNAYFTSSPWAKFSGNGVAQPAIDDLFLYINAYFGTCS